MTGFAFGFTVTVYRVPPTKDRWGDTAGAPPTHTVPGCSFYLPTSTEVTQGQDTIVDRGVLLAPYGADIVATDEVELPDDAAVPPAYRGSRWRVDGTPAQWRSPLTGWQPGDEYQLRRERG